MTALGSGSEHDNGMNRGDDADADSSPNAHTSPAGSDDREEDRPPAPGAEPSGDDEAAAGVEADPVDEEEAATGDATADEAGRADGEGTLVGGDTPSADGKPPVDENFVVEDHPALEGRSPVGGTDDSRRVDASDGDPGDGNPGDSDARDDDPKSVTPGGHDRMANGRRVTDEEWESVVSAWHAPAGVNSELSADEVAGYLEESEGYTPPDPGPIGVHTAPPILVLCWLLAVGGPLILLIAVLFVRPVPGLLVTGGVVAALAGITGLFWQLPRDAGASGGDGSAV